VFFFVLALFHCYDDLIDDGKQRTKEKRTNCNPFVYYLHGNYFFSLHVSGWVCACVPVVGEELWRPTTSFALPTFSPSFSFLFRLFHGFLI
jgi:hypothetical protein